MSFQFGKVVTLTKSEVDSLRINPNGRSDLHPGVQFSVVIEYVNEDGTFVTPNPSKYPAETFTARYKVLAQEVVEPGPAEQFPENGFGKTVTIVRHHFDRYRGKFELEHHEEQEQGALFTSKKFSNLFVKVQKAIDTKGNDVYHITFVKRE
jgi:hypothetical protein